MKSILHQILKAVHNGAHPDKGYDKIKPMTVDEAAEKIRGLIPKRKGDEIDPGFLRDGYNQAISDFEASLGKEGQ